MIILQILALLILIPFTALLIIPFNIYLMQWMYLILVTIIGMLYAALCGLVFHNFHGAIFIFIMLTIVYVIRMGSLAAKIKMQPHINYPIVRGKIKNKKSIFNATFLCPLSILKILKLMPNCINKAIARNTGLDIQLSDVVDQVLDRCRGTRIEIANDEIDILFEII